jgi:primosomal protein N' (replication factor Y) (superfamily II helicase)
VGGDRPRRRPPTSARAVAVEKLGGPVAVCIDRPVLSLDRPFTYELPDDLDAGIGSLVQVRFHGKLTRGWVLGPTDDLPPRMLKVHKVVSPVRFFDERLLELYRWMSQRYVAPLATVIGRSFPPRVVGEDNNVGLRDTPLARSRSLGGLSPAPTQSISDAYRGGSRLFDAIRSRGRGTFRVRPIPEQEQTLAVDAVRCCLEAGRRAIVIVAEAEPLPATAARLVEAFGDRVGLFVGGGKRERYRAWLEIQGGRYDVVVGTRPAVFAPLRDLGLIWLSRESHALHREERSPYFHVRDVAAERAEIEGAVFVMSALCHSSEAAVMPATDVEPATRAWPPVEVVKPGPEGRAPRLVAALKGSSRAFLFEPLRGYGVARVCKACGRPAACAECGGALRVEEKRVRCVVCEAPGRCAECGSTDFGIARGGAERVEEWLGRLVHVPVRRGDHPEAGSGVTVGGAESVKEIDPPGLDLVGVLDADLAARRPGLSAMEHSLVVWMEAAGWARPNGRVIVQTKNPSDPAVQSLVQGTPARHHRAERGRREAAGFPPGFPVFRVLGGRDLRAGLDEAAPLHVLETSLGDETVCLITVRPEAVAEFGRAVRVLAERGVVTRVEAEPHL